MKQYNIFQYIAIYVCFVIPKLIINYMCTCICPVCCDVLFVLLQCCLVASDKEMAHFTFNGAKRKSFLVVTHIHSMTYAVV